MNNPSRASFWNILATISKWLVVLLLMAAIADAAWWLVLVPPRVQQLYKRGANQYQAGDYAGAISTLEQAYRLNPRHVWVNILLGSSHWRSGNPQQAEFYFAQAHRLNPSVEEAKLGLAFSSLALQHTDTALPLFQELARKHPKDKEIQMSLADAYIKAGRNFQATEVYRAILEADPADHYARRELLGLYGYPERHGELPLELPAIQRPAEPEIYFRTSGEHFQVRTGEEWKTVYVVGVNIGPARPGEYPSTASRDFSVYFEWFRQIGAMNANTVRVYTVLPPAFYQALKAYNETGAPPLWLVQEVWLDEDVEDLYAPQTEREFQQAIRDTIDLLHGHANLAYRRGHHYGIYTADVSRWVLALAIGREVEPKLVLFTNRKHASHTSYKGDSISLDNGSPTDVWFARMCDLAASYEVEKYNAQRPLTIVNWPPLDPMTHPSEGTYADELRIRKSVGEEITEVIQPDVVYNDMDVVSLDITKFRTEPGFAAGLFALYHVYQHWPDFLLHESGYPLARDAEGPNRYLGYLQELKRAHPNFPLFIGEYGVSSSLGVSHIHPQGWNNGGLTEKQQAELVVRFTKNIRDVGCAGGLVFEWQDEPFKHVGDLDTADFERPWERNPFWLNPMDPEKNFGLVGYEPAGRVPLLRGDPDDWVHAEPLYYIAGRPTEGPPGELRAVYAFSDFAYFYLRLDVEPAALDWSHWNFWIALNTLPGQSGSTLLPEIGVRLESGANFLIQLTGPSFSRILIAENYSPNERISIPGRSGRTRVWRKKGLNVSLVESARFVERITEANMARYGHDGRIFPALDYNRSHLPYGTADRTSPEFSNHALWHADAKKGMIELRIPWGLLLVMDPSSMEVFAGTDQNRYTSVHEAWFPLSKPTKGITVAVFALYVPGPVQPKVVSSSLPLLSGGKLVSSLPVYTWAKWNTVEYRPYFKQSYSALQKVFEDLVRTGKGPPDRKKTTERGPSTR